LLDEEINIAFATKVKGLHQLENALLAEF
jgi:hypothetical protein